VRRIVVIGCLALVLAGCSTVTVTPMSSPAVTCEPPPTISVAIDASGTQSILPILLTCDTAIAATKAALTTDLGTVVSLDFGYGHYCPPGLPCAPYYNADAGFVVVGFADTQSVVASVSLVSGGAVTVTKIDKLAALNPRQSP
jgi:hypothetical protein